MGTITRDGNLEPNVRTRCVDDRISDYLANEVGGGTSANGDYSVTPATFSYGPGAGVNWIIERMIIYIADTGAFSADEYGNTGSALSNGYDVKIVDSGGDIKTLNGSRPFTTNGDIGAVCYDVNNIGSGSSGADAILVRWTFSKAGAPIRLLGDNGGKISITFSDNLSALTAHTFFIDGYIE